VILDALKRETRQAFNFVMLQAVAHHVWQELDKSSSINLKTRHLIGAV
jgi:hypothetical protein